MFGVRLRLVAASARSAPRSTPFGISSRWLSPLTHTYSSDRAFATAAKGGRKKKPQANDEVAIASESLSPAASAATSTDAAVAESKPESKPKARAKKSNTASDAATAPATAATADTHTTAASSVPAAPAAAPDAAPVAPAAKKTRKKKSDAPPVAVESAAAAAVTADDAAASAKPKRARKKVAAAATATAAAVAEPATAAPDFVATPKARKAAAKKAKATPPPATEQSPPSIPTSAPIAAAAVEDDATEAPKPKRKTRTRTGDDVEAGDTDALFADNSAIATAAAGISAAPPVAKRKRTPAPIPAERDPVAEQAALDAAARERAKLDPVTVVNDKASAERVLAILQSDAVRSRYHACDTEVTDIDIDRSPVGGNGTIICASIFVGHDIDFGNGPRIWIDNLDAAKGTLDYFKAYFEDKSIRKVWHNVSFDRHVFSNHGIDVQGFGGDTMHMARLWNSSLTFEGGYSLAALSERLLEKKKTPMKERFGLFGKTASGTDRKIAVVPAVVDLQRNEQTRHAFIDYSVYDAEATYMLRERLEGLLKAIPWTADKNMFDFYDTYWRPFGEMLTDMERAGFLIAPADYLPSIQVKAEADRELYSAKFRAWAIAQAGPDAQYMNISSVIQKQQFFFGPYIHTDPRSGLETPKLEAEKHFQTANTAGVVAEGKTKATKFMPFILKGLGMKPKELTPSGLPRVSLPVLQELAGSKLDSAKPKYGTAYKFFSTRADDGKVDHAAGHDACVAIDSLCKVAAVNMTLNTFIKPLQTGTDAEGRIHCSLNLNTETGRLSARNPNLQNQPALEKDIYKIRNAFAAPAGKKLIVADYGQLELRILAHMADCKSMIEAFRLGGDFHSRTAMGMYPNVRSAVDKKEVLLEWDHKLGAAPAPLLKDVFPTERRRAKILNFSIAYGKTARGLASDWEVSLEEARDTLELWYRDRPEVKKWQAEMKQFTHQNKYTVTLMGRRRYLMDVDSRQASVVSHAERAAINTPIQGGAADVVMAAMLKIHQNDEFRRLGWRIILQVHDEIIAEGPTESTDQAMAIVRDSMARPFRDPLKVELTVDAKADTTWYKAK